MTRVESLRQRSLVLLETWLRGGENRSLLRRSWLWSPGPATQLKSVCNPSSREPAPSSWPPQAMHTCGTYTNIQANSHTPKSKNNLFKNWDTRLQVMRSYEVEEGKNTTYCLALDGIKSFLPSRISGRKPSKGDTSLLKAKKNIFHFCL